MGDFNQWRWVEKNVGAISAPKRVLEIGSKSYGEQLSYNYRALFPNAEYVGLDLEPGENVDIALDMTKPLERITEEIGGGFDVIICCSVMEHVKDIFTFAKNTSALLAPSGKLFISVPFCWEVHGYPSDYWRFTPEAVKFLFPEILFLSVDSTISSNINNDVVSFEESTVNDFSFFKFSKSRMTWTRKLVNSVKVLMNRPVDGPVIAQSVDGNRLIKVCTINMVGIKK